MSAYYVPQLNFTRPDAEPRILINTSGISTGAIPVTQFWRAGEAIAVDQDGSIETTVNDAGTSLKTGDMVKLSGITTVGFTSLNGKTLMVTSITGTGPSYVKLSDCGLRPEATTVLNDETAITLQLGYSYVEFFGFKAVGSANTAATLVGPNKDLCLQPLGLGTKDGYASTPTEGRRWNLQDWHFKVAADNDGVLMAVWK